MDNICPTITAVLVKNSLSSGTTTLPDAIFLCIIISICQDHCACTDFAVSMYDLIIYAKPFEYLLHSELTQSKIHLRKLMEVWPYTTRPTFPTPLKCKSNKPRFGADCYIYICYINVLHILH